MDVFSRTFLPTATEAGIPLATVTRHLPVIGRCVDPDDPAVLVARVRPASQLGGEFLMLLTYRRLVVTRETRVLHRLQLHLNAHLRHLSHVTWAIDPRDSTIEMCATAVDGVRERFQMRVTDPAHGSRLDAVLKQVFTERRRNVSLAA
ncbi:hypothetical protein [Actinoplanes sp. NPDC049265]|uniref:hypothetical protein n=1 Tax=Actinoplanes sp. NPDC049265 TaxID=3363902 RepID=UPI003718A0B6